MNEHSTMTYLAAAEGILASVPEPLTVRAITDAAIGRGLLKPTGKTPIATMSASLYTELQRS